MKRFLPELLSKGLEGGNCFSVNPQPQGILQCRTGHSKEVQDQAEKTLRFSMIFSKKRNKIVA
jgi:hypothetical protein